jgi:hypothetical protein
MSDQIRLHCRGLLLTAAILAVGGFGARAAAQCSDQDHVAIVVFADLWPDFTPEVTTLAVTPVGPAVYPDEDQVRMILLDYFETLQDVVPGDAAGNLWSWWGLLDFSAQALVDRRDGAVLFAGTVVWMGTGYLLYPLVSTHDWAVVPAEPAPEPASTATYDNSFWEDPFYPAVGELTAAALAHLRTTDVIHSFAGCGDYQVVGWVYTPSVGLTDPSVAKLIVAIDGKVGPPWNGQEVAVEQTTWSGLKARYR